MNDRLSAARDEVIAWARAAVELNGFASDCQDPLHQLAAALAGLDRLAGGSPGDARPESRRKPEYRMAFDLEMNQPSRAIIQIGAVVGDVMSGEVVDRLSVVVDPGEPLAEAIVKLTGVTEERIREQGVSLTEAYGALAGMHAKWSCAATPIVWGSGRQGNDALELWGQLREAGHFGDHGGRDCTGGKYVFAGWRDVKAIFQEYCLANGVPPRSGLARSLLKIGMAFEGRAHDAMWDALNTFRVASFLANVMVDPNAVPGVGRPRPKATRKAKENAARRKRPGEVASDIAGLINSLSETAQAAAVGADVDVTENGLRRRLSIPEAGRLLKGLRESG